MIVSLFLILFHLLTVLDAAVVVYLAGLCVAAVDYHLFEKKPHNTLR
jgi:hypothetical protein